MYTVKRGWIDCAGKCRTWIIVDDNDQRRAELTRKREAHSICQSMNEAAEIAAALAACPLRCAAWQRFCCHGRRTRYAPIFAALSQ